MHDPPSLPEDLIVHLAQGKDDTLEDNYASFLARFKEQRDKRKDWFDGFHRLNLKTMTAFELSVRLTWLVDKLAALSASSNGSAEAQSNADDIPPYIIEVLIVEYMILKLNSATPLRDHPLLLHWVATADRIRGDLLGNRDKLGTPEYGIQEIFLKSRLKITYCALKGIEEFAGVDGWLEKHIGVMTPMQLMNHSVQMEGEPVWLDLSPYAILLDKTGVTLSWELAALLPDPSMQSPEQRLANVEIENKPSPARESESTPTRNSSIPTVADIEKWITIEPEQTVHFLTRLPLDLPSLNFLTQLASTTILDDAGADTIHICREYIQYCLRSIEKMGMSPGQDGATSSNTSNVSIDPPSSEFSNEPVRGREEQIRDVGWLVMFMKSLIEKGLVPPQELHYEIQEVCVRYIFVKDVREFRAFLEGEELEEMMGKGMGG
jgi:hypothetical protein